MLGAPSPVGPEGEIFHKVPRRDAVIPPGNDGRAHSASGIEIIMDNIYEKQNLMETETHVGKVGKIETQLKQWGAKVHELVAKADQAGAEAKTDYHNRIDDLKAKYRIARSKLAELKAESNEKWEALKTGVETAWKEFWVVS
jgi:chromosome segregation ATPase